MSRPSCVSCNQIQPVTRRCPACKCDYDYTCVGSDCWKISLEKHPFICDECMDMDNNQPDKENSTPNTPGRKYSTLTKKVPKRGPGSAEKKKQNHNTHAVTQECPDNSKPTFSTASVFVDLNVSDSPPSLCAISDEENFDPLLKPEAETKGKFSPSPKLTRKVINSVENKNQQQNFSKPIFDDEESSSQSKNNLGSTTDNKNNVSDEDNDTSEQIEENNKDKQSHGSNVINRKNINLNNSTFVIVKPQHCQLCLGKNAKKKIVKDGASSSVPKETKPDDSQEPSSSDAFKLDEANTTENKEEHPIVQLEMTDFQSSEETLQSLKNVDLEEPLSAVEKAKLEEIRARNTDIINSLQDMQSSAGKVSPLPHEMEEAACYSSTMEYATAYLDYMNDKREEESFVIIDNENSTDGPPKSLLAYIETLKKHEHSRESNSLFDLLPCDDSDHQKPSTSTNEVKPSEEKNSSSSDESESWEMVDPNIISKPIEIVKRRIKNMPPHYLFGLSCDSFPPEECAIRRCNKGKWPDVSMTQGIIVDPSELENETTPEGEASNVNICTENEVVNDTDATGTRSKKGDFSEESKSEVENGEATPEIPLIVVSNERENEKVLPQDPTEIFEMEDVIPAGPSSVEESSKPKEKVVTKEAKEEISTEDKSNSEANLIGEASGSSEPGPSGLSSKTTEKRVPKFDISGMFEPVGNRSILHQFMVRDRVERTADDSVGEMHPEYCKIVDGELNALTKKDNDIAEERRRVEIAENMRELERTVERLDNDIVTDASGIFAGFEHIITNREMRLEELISADQFSTVKSFWANLVGNKKPKK